MDSFFRTLSLGCYQLTQSLIKEKRNVVAAFAIPIKKNGEIDISQSADNNTTDLNNLLFNSYNDSLQNNK
jgi:hypothetical protein